MPQLQLLTPDLLELLARDGTTKILSTVDEHNIPYGAPSPFLHSRQDGLLVHLELLETTPTNHNLLRSLWHDRKVAVTVTGRDGRAFHVQAAPIKVLISGPVFSLHYEQVRSVLPDADLSGVWLLRPLAVVDETYQVRRQEEEAHHPFSVHLDRLLLSRSTITKGEAQS